MPLEGIIRLAYYLSNKRDHICMVFLFHNQILSHLRRDTEKRSLLTASFLEQIYIYIYIYIYIWISSIDAGMS